MVEFRVNLIKSTVEEIEKELDNNGIKYEKASFANWAFYVDTKLDVIQDLKCYKQGKIYVQSFSSMIPPIVLDPKENENILDMCAAPGGKTTEIASLTNNKALITACELNKIRLERLNYNINLQGAKVNVINQDSRKLSDYFKFDKILLDAPCTGSGTLELSKYDSLPQGRVYDRDVLYLRKKHSSSYISKLNRTQKDLVKKAINMLNSGGVLVYSTCSLLPEENDFVVDYALSTNKVKLEKIEINNLPIMETENFEESITIRPTKYYEGFYVAKLIKI